MPPSFPYRGSGPVRLGPPCETASATTRLCQKSRGKECQRPRPPHQRSVALLCHQIPDLESACSSRRLVSSPKPRFGAVKAVNAARMAMKESGGHKVSLDQVIRTMYQTGLDMQTRYKETALGGLPSRQPSDQ